jgi:hypothetical protein
MPTSSYETRRSAAWPELRNEPLAELPKTAPIVQLLAAVLGNWEDVRALTPAETERMPCRIRVDLEALRGPDVFRRLQQCGTQ